MRTVRKEQLVRCSAGCTMMSRKSALTWPNRAGWESRSSQSLSPSSPMSGHRMVSSTHGGSTTSPPRTSLRAAVAHVKNLKTCKTAGVRVYADAVVNHMSGGGNDILNHRNGSSDWCTNWGGKGTSDNSGKGSPYFTHNWTYEKAQNTGLIPGLEYPNAAYIPTDFHCECSLSSWTDPFQLNKGMVVGLGRSGH